MSNIWFVFLKYLIGGQLFVAMQRCNIVHMNGMEDREFPPQVRYAGIKVYCLSLVH
jgi:hypothetical protein